MRDQFDQPHGALLERVRAIPVDVLAKQWEPKYRWYFVAGAADYLRNGTDRILQNFDAYQNDRDTFREVIAISAESWIKDFTPSGWVEPIRKPVGYVSQELCREVADAVTAALFDRA